jgi:two-component system C4-dicarboxylate transport sensor histidine kinase DctB
VKRIANLRLLALAIVMVVVFAILTSTYRASVIEAAITEARKQAERRASLQIGALVADVEKFRVLPFVLVELPDVRSVLGAGSAPAKERLDRKFAALAVQTKASVLYAVDQGGTARSASNATGPDSFVGYSFRFRPYFVEALRDGSSEYFAQGSVTGRPGMFLARRVGTPQAALGVIVVKIEFDRIERLWRSAGQRSLIVDRDGIIVVGTDPSLRFRTIAALPRARRAQIEGSRQFGNARLDDAGLRFDGRGFAVDGEGTRYLAVEQRLPMLGWRHVHLEPLKPAIDAAGSRVRFASLILGLAMAALLLLLAWNSSRRRRIEDARSELEAEVARRTAELTRAYDQLQYAAKERENSDTRYRSAREELAQANRLGSIGTITTSVAHEINQPVAAIRTAAENSVKLLGRDQADSAVANLQLIVSLTQRIGAITGELLSYARRGQRENTTTALDEIVDGALMLVGDSFRAAGVRLEVQRPPNLPLIHASRIRIGQVLVNLLQNALDAVTGVQRPHVRLEVSVAGETVRLSVSDNGAGIANDLVETIFQPFFTGKPQGTGLGLGISREIVWDHGGTLSVGFSALGGAEFTVLLPHPVKGTK